MSEREKPRLPLTFRMYLSLEPSDRYQIDLNEKAAVTRLGKVKQSWLVQPYFQNGLVITALENPHTFVVQLQTQASFQPVSFFQFFLQTSVVPRVLFNYTVDIIPQNDHVAK